MADPVKLRSEFLPSAGQRGRRPAEDANHPGTVLLAPLPDRAGLRVTGEIDMSAHEIWATALETVSDADGDVHLELSGLDFIDTKGTSLLVAAAQRLSEHGRRVVVHHPPATFTRVLNLMWPGLSTIEVRR